MRSISERRELVYIMAFRPRYVIDKIADSYQSTLLCMNCGELDLNDMYTMVAYLMGFLFQNGHCGVTIHPFVASHMAYGPGKMVGKLMETYEYLEDGHFVMRMYPGINIIVADHN